MIDRNQDLLPGPLSPEPLICRRQMRKMAGGSALGAIVGAGNDLVRTVQLAAGPTGTVVGENTAARVGRDVLAGGGNVVDAVVAAALVACVVAPSNCGLGGYGGHMMVALANRNLVRAIDFNTAAPAAATKEMFTADERGLARGEASRYGWLAIGVPGTLAGVQLASDRFGTRPLRELAAPAIHLAQEGFAISQGLASAIKGRAAQLLKDPTTARLLFKDGRPLSAGETLRNSDLARMLSTLAEQNSVESFYRGDIAQRIADAAQKHGGLLTKQDMMAYQAREVAPLELEWQGNRILTAPLTAGGVTTLEAMAILKALNWTSWPDNATKVQARIEALRVAWRDRLQLLSDPSQTEAPVERLLSADYTSQMAEKIKNTLKTGQPLIGPVETRTQDGTIHLSAVDQQGNLVAMTLTHGDSFGACVAVEGLGLILGHGMSRFELRPNHPNAPGPRKRPLHNMCPTIVLQDNIPVAALGGAGGRKIPNSVFDVLTRYIGQKMSLEQAMVAPRLHTEGSLNLTLDSRWPKAEEEYLKQLGYKIQTGNGALVSAVWLDPATRAWHFNSR